MLNTKICSHSNIYYAIYTHCVCTVFSIFYYKKISYFAVTKKLTTIQFCITDK